MSHAEQVIIVSVLTFSDRFIVAIMANFAPRNRGNSPHHNTSTLSVGSARKRSISSARSDRSFTERKRARERHVIDLANVSQLKRLQSQKPSINVVKYREQEKNR